MEIVGHIVHIAPAVSIALCCTVIKVTTVYVWLCKHVCWMIPDLIHELYSHFRFAGEYCECSLSEQAIRLLQESPKRPDCTVILEGWVSQ